MSARPDADAHHDSTAPPAPSLAEQVAALNVGDKIRATYADPFVGDYVVEGRLRAARGSNALWIGILLVRTHPLSPYEDLVSVEVLEAAAVAFYTNAPADRKPRLGDVARGYVGTNVYVGDGWVATAARGSGREIYHPFRFDAGRLALVDPAELAEEES